MLEINGKVLVFTDLHVGLKNAQLNRLKLCKNVVEQIADYAKKAKAEAILFLGDWNHSRVAIDSNALNVSYKLMHKLAESAKVYAVLGNHDIYMKNSLDINSLVVFKDIDNVEVIDKPLLFKLNGSACALVPWLSDLSSMKKESIDMLFGHFDIDSKYLMKSYIEQNQQKALSNQLRKDIEKELKSNTNDLVGSFVDVVKKNGKIFAGHIHTHREFLSKGRWMAFVGSPYQQNLGEANCRCGFYEIDERNNLKFIDTKNVPKHIEVYASQLVKEDFDYKMLHGNIVHKVYDVELSLEEDAKISQKINDQQPFEELMPEYQVKVKDAADDPKADEQAKLIKKSKLEYLRKYVSTIDKTTLDDQHLDSAQLIKILEQYYNKAMEQ